MRMSEQERASKMKQILPLLENCHEAALATIDAHQPFVSLIGFLYERDADPAGLGKVYFLLSDLARHTRYLKSHPVVSLLVSAKAGSKPVHERERATITGTVTGMESQEKFAQLKEKYLAVFPGAEVFFTLRDFRFYSLTPEEIYWVGGFGKVITVR